MIIIPFIFGLLFILLTIASIFLFKIIFKVEKLKGFLVGIISSLITCAAYAIIIIISVFVLNKVISNNVNNGSIDILINSINDVSELNQLPFLTLFLAWGIIALLFLVLFLSLFFSIKIISKSEDDSSLIFIFFSGFILIPSIFWYVFCILLSFKINIFSNITNVEFDIFSNYFILLFEFGALFFIILIAGTSIMIMLHHKEYNNLIIWICVFTFFVPVIFYFFGFLSNKAFFFSFLNGACPLVSIILACFLYRKYASSPRSSGSLLQNRVEMT